jgi:hypothetical protein
LRCAQWLAVPDEGGEDDLKPARGAPEPQRSEVADHEVPLPPGPGVPPGGAWRFSFTSRSVM